MRNWSLDRNGGGRGCFLNRSARSPLLALGKIKLCFESWVYAPRSSTMLGCLMYLSMARVSSSISKLPSEASDSFRTSLDEISRLYSHAGALLLTYCLWRYLLEFAVLIMDVNSINNAETSRANLSIEGEWKHCLLVERSRNEFSGK